MPEIRLSGRPASPGFARGRLFKLPPAGAATRVATGDPQAEEQALRQAIARALTDVSALAQAAEGEGADILSFQLALLSDEELYRGALDAIRAGDSAHEAWHTALSAEIAGYANTDDPYLRARSADFADIRDQVACHLAGGLGGGGLPDGALVIADDLAPSRFLATDWSKGGAVLLIHGSPTSHVAMLARSRQVPMVVALGEGAFAAGELASREPGKSASGKCEAAPGGFAPVGDALVDAERGLVVIDPDLASIEAFEGRRLADAALFAKASALAACPGRSADGTPIAVWLNIAEPGELDALDPALGEGIGLVRTEFLFHSGGAWPDEEAQYRVYRRILAWAGQRPVTIRTLDAGGDKPIPGLTVGGESNPFLGIRGIRLSLRRPEVFRVQLRALARAAALGPLKVMLPMVTAPQELEAARLLLREEIAAARARGIAVAEPVLGIMVEVPAAALALDQFDAAFFSIGSNDLTQYVTAAARDSGALADLADTRHPGVLRLIAAITRHGRESGREVSLCGDAGGDPALLPDLLAAGVRIVSMAPALVPRAKAAIATIDLGQAKRP
jgi:phosphoenolpyruvate-protein phosphotransferase (PTS system enzyme I)